MRVLADGQTHTHTDTHTDANRFYNLSMLYAIAMGQIKIDELTNKFITLLVHVVKKSIKS